MKKKKPEFAMEFNMMAQHKLNEELFHYIAEKSGYSSSQVFSEVSGYDEKHKYYPSEKNEDAILVIVDQDNYVRKYRFQR